MEENIKKSKDQFIKFANSCNAFKNDLGMVFNLECEENIKVIDVMAGLDNVVVRDSGIRGVSFRYQTSSWNNPNFTVRRLTDNGNFNTELKKRSFAILNYDKGYLFPWFTVQYWPNKNVALLARTVDVILDTVYSVNVFDATNPTTNIEERTQQNGKFSYTTSDKFVRKYTYENGLWLVSGVSLEYLNSPLALQESEIKILEKFSNR